jgi:hypothetical protein
VGLTCAATFATPPEFNYIKRESREASRAATMAQYQATLDWTDWHIIGPFPNVNRGGHDIVFPPETEIDLGATYPGKGGRAVAWKPAIYCEWDFMDLEQFGEADAHRDAVAYLFRDLVAEKDATIEFDVGSDDGLKLWFNRNLLIDADEYRGLNVDDHRIKLDVRAGRNTLLAKITEGEGQWHFQMRPVVDHRIEALLQYHLDEDFPASDEARHYRILTILEPDDMVLEVGGLDCLPDGRPIVCTRRGEVWIVDGAYDRPPFNAKFTRFASGLHEPLGLRFRNGTVEVAQRGELTRLRDENGDDRADVYETLSDQWGISGNYHEFAFGPKFDKSGRTWVTLNLGFCDSLGKSTVPWRGWAIIVNGDGSLTPVCGGLRSPNGLGCNAAGDMFYTDNQGDWVGTNKLAHLDFGDWHGHPGGNQWYDEAGMSPPRGEESFKPPAVWFPYKSMGQSASDILLDDTGGGFGPFGGQLFVGDQTNASVMRVFLERVNGVYQGACFPFRSGFDCGVNRMCFAPDGSMFVGMTNRGWGSLGRRAWGLQRLVYTGVPPFEVLEVKAQPDGFMLTFTEPIDPATAADPAGYAMSSFTYRRWATYGSPEIDRRELSVSNADVSVDGRSVRLIVDGLRAGHVHALRCPSIRNRAGERLLHDEAYYTLNVIPLTTSPAAGD